MKVKIIVKETSQDLEDAINEFIDGKTVYDIKFQKHGMWVRSLIMYDEPFIVKGVVAVEDVKKVLLNKEK